MQVGLGAGRRAVRVGLAVQDRVAGSAGRGVSAGGWQDGQAGSAGGASGRQAIPWQQWVCSAWSSGSPGLRDGDRDRQIPSRFYVAGIRFI